MRSIVLKKLSEQSTFPNFRYFDFLLHKKMMDKLRAVFTKTKTKLSEHCRLLYQTEPMPPLWQLCRDGKLDKVRKIADIL